MKTAIFDNHSGQACPEWLSTQMVPRRKPVNRYSDKKAELTTGLGIENGN